MRILLGTLLLLVSFVSVAHAQTDKRVALVIGNGDYGKVGKLANPTRDASAVEALLAAVRTTAEECRLAAIGRI